MDLRRIERQSEARQAGKPSLETRRYLLNQENCASAPATCVYISHSLIAFIYPEIRGIVPASE
jgi:hypothetical protein